jgi:hypothetical protein
MSHGPVRKRSSYGKTCWVKIKQVSGSIAQPIAGIANVLQELFLRAVLGGAVRVTIVGYWGYNHGNNF